MTQSAALEERCDELKERLAKTKLRAETTKRKRNVIRRERDDLLEWTKEIDDSDDGESQRDSVASDQDFSSRASSKNSSSEENSFFKNGENDRDDEPTKEVSIASVNDDWTSSSDIIETSNDIE